VPWGGNKVVMKSFGLSCMMDTPVSVKCVHCVL